MPCGAGKTTCFVSMAKGAAERGRRVLILVHRSELMAQASATLERGGVKHGIIAPGRYGELQNVAVASVQTLRNRIVKAPIHFDFIIGDEAHREEISAGLRFFPTAHILGVTATPCRTDGQGLGRSSGGVFERIVMGPTTAELIHMGHLVEPVIFAPPNDLDLTGVRSSKGDYVGSQAAERVNKPSITGSAVEHYSKMAPGEPCVVFTASVQHAETVANDFNAAGYRFEVVHGKLDLTTRTERLGRVKSGRSNGVVNVDILTTGTDIPALSVGIWLRPTKSLSLWIQGNGRLLRPSGSKHRALILDHCQNWVTGGGLVENYDWTLDGENKKRLKAGEDETIVRQCRKCFAVYDEGIVCPYCGHQNPPKPRKIEERDGELKRITKEEIENARANKKAEYQSATTWEQITAIAARRGDNMYSIRMRWGRKFGQRV